jgi:hypothetical protein
MFKTACVTNWLNARHNSYKTTHTPTEIQLYQHKLSWPQTTRYNNFYSEVDTYLFAYNYYHIMWSHASAYHVLP